LLIDIRHLGVPRTFFELLDPLVDGARFPLDRRLDAAVAVVCDPPLESQAPRHTRGEKAISDTLHFSVDADVPLLPPHLGADSTMTALRHPTSPQRGRRRRKVVSVPFVPSVVNH